MTRLQYTTIIIKYHNRMRTTRAVGIQLETDR